MQKSEPVAGLAHSVTSVALGCSTRTAIVGRRLNRLTGCCRHRDLDREGAGVLLQIINSSKLGWRAPSDRCLTKLPRAGPIGSRSSWTPARCASAARAFKQYLDRGYLVLVTGSKFFTGPPFSGALLVPAGLAERHRCDRRDRAGNARIQPAAATGRCSGRA